MGLVIHCNSVFSKSHKQALDLEDYKESQLYLKYLILTEGLKMRGSINWATICFNLIRNTYIVKQLKQSCITGEAVSAYCAVAQNISEELSIDLCIRQLPKTRDMSTIHFPNLIRPQIIGVYSGPVPPTL